LLRSLPVPHVLLPALAHQYRQQHGAVGGCRRWFTGSCRCCPRRSAGYTIVVALRLIPCGAADAH
jgi:hypothetical protein